jgi:hypothetical protein
MISRRFERSIVGNAATDTPIAAGPLIGPFFDPGSCCVATEVQGGLLVNSSGVGHAERGDGLSTAGVDESSG